jgi:hypothetical protein
MTFILSTTDRPYTETPTARIAARTAIVPKRLLVALVCRLISVPSAIGAAFAMAYVDPYQQNCQQNDYSDPQNF